MKLANSTDWPNHFLRRMVAWCCRQIDLPPSSVRLATFRNRTTCSYSGHAWGSMRFVVSIGPDSRFPTGGHLYPGRTDEAYRAPVFADRIECLVAVTAHELTHLREYEQRRRNPAIRTGERRTMHNERRILEQFRAERESLLAVWNEAPPERQATPKLSAVERRAAAAEKALAQWQRKLKLAQTKVKKYKTKVRYYDRKAASRAPQP